MRKYGSMCGLQMSNHGKPFKGTWLKHSRPGTIWDDFYRKPLHSEVIIAKLMVPMSSKRPACWDIRGLTGKKLTLWKLLSMDQYMQTIMNLIRVETKVKSEWSSTLWKIKLVLNITIEKATGTMPLRLVISIDGATYT